MNKEKIISVLSELHKISGFRVSLHSPDFDEIAAYPEDKLPFCAALHSASAEEYKLCRECDKSACKKALNSKSTLIYKCRHGLIEAISPLYNFGILTGFLMMGQIFPSMQRSDASETLIKCGLSDIDAKKITDAIPVIDENKINSYVNIMTICASYLTMSNSVTAPRPTVAKLTMRYITENYSKRISISDICTDVGYSKSTVLSAFKKEYSTTINSYLVALRLDHAKKLLTDESVTINEIALNCGFSDQSYFSKVFSAKYGITPTAYRKGERH